MITFQNFGKDMLFMDEPSCLHRCSRSLSYILIFLLSNVKPIDSCTSHIDDCCPLFHFWHHHLDQNWHHLYSRSAGGRGLSNDTQIRVIGSVEPEISLKMLKNVVEKLRAKLFATTYGYSMVKFARLDDAL